MRVIHCLFFYLFQFSRITDVQLIYTDLADVITKFGYPGETHDIQTEDGYIITTFRIPHGIRNTNSSRGVVLLNHGLLATAGDYVILSAEKSIGYILAENGYDVWLMNARGNTYSKRHINIKESNKKAFYNFSYHEIGMYDIPANIDYILNATNQNQLHYIGHSQGGATFLIMTSTRPEYNRKIRHSSLLAPAAFLWNVNPLLGLLANMGKMLDNMREMLQLYNLPMVEFLRNLAHSICSNPRSSAMCLAVINLIGGYSDSPQFVQKTYEEATRITPADISLRQMVHFTQSINTRKFQMYDFGQRENLRRYNQKTPPDYNLDNIDAPVTIYVGENDHFVGVDACELLKRKIRNGTLKIVPHKLFNHVDFLYAKDVVSLLYDDMLRTMALY